MQNLLGNTPRDNVTLDSRALFLFTEGAAIEASRESRVGIVTLKGPVVQNQRKRKSILFLYFLSAIVIFSKKREKIRSLGRGWDNVTTLSAYYIHTPFDKLSIIAYIINILDTQNM